MTDDEIIAVVQAHKEGKKIQCRNFVNPIGWGEWYDVETPNWNFLFHEFRVAPEPRKPRVLTLVYKGAGTWKEECSCNIGLDEKPIRFLEVIE